MIDLKNHKAEWVQEKRKDLEYLQSVDYARLDRMVENAIGPNSAKQLVKAKKEVQRYSHRILQDRSGQSRITQVDTEIDRLVSTYLDIKTRLDKQISIHKVSQQMQFHQSYDSDNPNIPALRKISKDYAAFQGTVSNLDSTILQYAQFDHAWTTVENRVDKATKAYISTKNNKGIKKIQEEIKTCKTTLDKTQKQAPKKFLRGIHKAYRYQNPELGRLATEVQRFEKEDFAKRRSSAERKIAIASDLIGLIERSDERDTYELLEAVSQENFDADFAATQKTIYFGNIPSKHRRTVYKLNTLAKETTQAYQEHLKKEIRLHGVMHVAANTHVADLQNQAKILKRDYERKIAILEQINPNASLKEEYTQGLTLIQDRISEIETNSSQQEEVKKEISTLNQQLENAETTMQKKDKRYKTKEIEVRKQIRSLEKEKSDLARQLEEEKGKKSALEQNLQEIKKSVADTKTDITTEIRQYVEQRMNHSTGQINNALNKISNRLDKTDQPKPAPQVKAKPKPSTPAQKKQKSQFIKVNFNAALKRKQSASVPSSVEEGPIKSPGRILNFKKAVEQKHLA